MGLLVISFQQTQTAASAQAQEDKSFTLRLGVDEVSLAFHISDKSGNSIANVPLSALRLWDDGTEQHRISSFHFYRNLPVRAGFLFDASGSMEKDLGVNEFIANLYASRMLQPGRDRAFVMGFGTDLQLTQDWTDNPESIAAGIQAISGRDYGTSGTAIFDSVYKVCRDRWGFSQDKMSGNFILLFTDGIDDASHARLKDAIDMCQRTRTSIYVFTNKWNLRGSSLGTKTLEALTSESGGRIFLNPKGDQIRRDIALLDSDLRTQYLLDFVPSKLKRDGSFHKIRIQCSIAGSSVLVRSGYYAFPHPPIAPPPIH